MKAIFSFIMILMPVLGQNDFDHIPINQIQVIGSHNSYKQAIDPGLFRIFQQRDSVSASKIDYEHISITDQLNMGLLNLEIDVYADENGGRYAHPKGLDWVKDQKPYDPEGKMKASGFKVFHIVDLDFRSHCLTFADCLSQLRQWSETHPDHNPVFITLEAKDQPTGNANLTIPEKFTQHIFDQLDKAILDGLGQNHLITPSMVQGKYETLEAAVLKNNWPTVKQAKGKFMFILDDNGSKREIYTSGHASLRGRLLFVNAEPGMPEAAMMIKNNPRDASIKDLVKKGYIIRTRADSDTREARADDRTSFDAACNSGAQIITTDYYLKSTHFKSDYSVSFEGGKYVRKNPVF